MMSTAGRVLIIGRIDSLKRRTSDSLLCLSARPSAATRLLLLLMLLLFGMCPTVVQSADNFDAVGDAMADPSPSHSHDSNSNNFDMHYDNFNQVTGNNETRILRRGKRYLEFPKGSRMSVGYISRHPSLPSTHTLFCFSVAYQCEKQLA